MAIQQGGFKPSNLPPVTDTGMKGFLKWFQREQPEIYRQIAGKISASYPQVFSDYQQSVTQAIRSNAGVASLIQRTRMRGGLSGLGQQSNVVDPTGEASITGMGYALNPDLTVNTGTLVGSGFDAPTTSALEDAASAVPNIPAAIDTADAANATAGTPTATTSGIASIISGITGLFTSINQQKTANAITQVQLQRAQAGLSPLNIGMNANGIPTLSSIGLSGGTLTIGALLLVGVLVFMGGRRGRAAA